MKGIRRRPSVKRKEAYGFLLIVSSEALTYYAIMCCREFEKGFVVAGISLAARVLAPVQSANEERQDIFSC